MLKSHKIFDFQSFLFLNLQKVKNFHKLTKSLGRVGVRGRGSQQVEPNTTSTIQLRMEDP
jgi:hypothetical protein